MHMRAPRPALLTVRPLHMHRVCAPVAVGRTTALQSVVIAI